MGGQDDRIGGQDHRILQLKKLASAIPVLFRKTFTGFAVNTAVFTVGFQEDLTAFLVWKMGDKFNDIHGFAYFHPRNIT